MTVTVPFVSNEPFTELRNPFSEAFRAELNAMTRKIQEIDELRADLEEAKVQLSIQPMYGAIHTAVIKSSSGAPPNVLYTAEAFGHSHIRVENAENQLRNIIKLFDEPATNALEWWPVDPVTDSQGWLYYHGSEWKLVVLESIRLKVGCDEEG